MEGRQHGETNIFSQKCKLMHVKFVLEEFLWALDKAYLPCKYSFYSTPLNQRIGKEKLDVSSYQI